MGGETPDRAGRIKITPQTWTTWVGGEFPGERPIVIEVRFMECKTV